MDANKGKLRLYCLTPLSRRGLLIAAQLTEAVAGRRVSDVESWARVPNRFLSTKLKQYFNSMQEESRGQRNPPRVLIFANTVKTVRFLHGLVREADFRAALLHGDRTQPEREVGNPFFFLRSFCLMWLIL